MNRDEVIALARTWIGVPFMHQGRSRMGVDCGGLLLAVGEEAGVVVVHPDAYSKSPDPAVIERALWANCRRITLAEALPGDVLWMSFAGEPRHVGFLTDVGILHAWAKPGAVVEHRIDTVWRQRIRSVWRPTVFGD